MRGRKAGRKSERVAVSKPQAFLTVFGESLCAESIEIYCCMSVFYMLRRSRVPKGQPKY